jgi:hypothetical protein
VLFAASIHVAMAATNCHILEVTQGYMPMMWDLFNEPWIRAISDLCRPSTPLFESGLSPIGGETAGGGHSASPIARRRPDSNSSRSSGWRKGRTLGTT